MLALLAVVLVVPTPHFRAAHGWLVGSSPARACVGVSADRCGWSAGWASTIRYRDCPNCIAPHHTLAHLPADGMVIQLTQVRERTDRASVGTWPPRIRSGQVTAGFEGVSNRYGVFQAFIRTEHLERSLFVWFGRAHPTRRQLARANAELRTVR